MGRQPATPRRPFVNRSPDPIAKQKLLVTISRGWETDPVHNKDLPPPLFRQRATLNKGTAGQTLPVRQTACAGRNGKPYFLMLTSACFRVGELFKPCQFLSLQTLWRSSS